MRYLNPLFSSSLRAGNTVKKIFAFIAVWILTLTTSNAQTGTWFGKIEVQGIKLPLVFHFDGASSTMDSPDQGAKGIPVQVERPDSSRLIIRIPSIDAEYQGRLTGEQIDGTFTQHAVPFPLTLTQKAQKPNRPQTPLPPFPYTREDVAFTNGDAVLKGTLTLPEGYSRETPVLLMVSGSGWQNRDEEIFEHRPFAVIADAFARAGIATLRYDDRGFGESTGDIIHCTTEDLKNDALAGIKLLRDRFDRVGIIGHSEGGTIAMMLAAENRTDFIISLAGMAVSGKETLIRQNQRALEQAGYPEKTIDTYCHLLSEAFDAVRNGSPMPDAEKQELPDELKQNYKAVLIQLQLPYLSYFISLDMRPVLGRISCPVLAFNGTKDAQVSCKENLDALRRGLPMNVKNRIEVAEGMNHLFQHSPTGNISEYRDIEETFAPEVIEDMILWIRSL